jgi:hypothetical protein
MGLAAFFFFGDGGIGLCGLACERVWFVLERGMGEDGRGVVSVDESVGYLCMISIGGMYGDMEALNDEGR